LTDPHLAGRLCPLHYLYPPQALARPAELQADTLLVAGGLYGNAFALDALERLMEPGAMLVLNGDFNWFNIDGAGFSTLNERVLQYTALRGNVETELDGHSTAGCGCAYPASVDERDVSHSNTIMHCLQRTASPFAAIRRRLSELPMHLVAQVGDRRIGIVHGDARSLAGWDFAHDRLHHPESARRLESVFRQSDVDVFASSHTCLPALRVDWFGGRQHAVINNGAAGMPNFAGTHFGLATRISVRPCPPTIRLYGRRIGAVFIDAIKLHYEQRAFVEWFAARWPAGSAGHQSYYSRIINGPAFSPGMALGADPAARDGQRARKPANSGRRRRT
jgi:hypothetical protein